MGAVTVDQAAQRGRVTMNAAATQQRLRCLGIQSIHLQWPISVPHSRLQIGKRKAAGNEHERGAIASRQPFQETAKQWVFELAEGVGTLLPDALKTIEHGEVRTVLCQGLV